MKTKKVHISEIKHGDTVIHEDKLTTVSNSNIKEGFCGITLFGDSYNMGTKRIEKVISF